MAVWRKNTEVKTEVHNADSGTSVEVGRVSADHLFSCPLRLH